MRFWLLLFLMFVGCARTRAPEGARTQKPRANIVSPLAPLAKTSTVPPKWDVENMPGETFEAKISVEEGTWISLDVSPDGKQIVFDLLGDIYLIPITGGAARSITHGVAWDMQPRFSPDGAWIAFVSDRDGMDNLHLIKP